MKVAEGSMEFGGICDNCMLATVLNTVYAKKCISSRFAAIYRSRVF